MEQQIIPLMRQLVTAAQSIALSVDVMSTDMRGLHRNVELMVRKEPNREVAPLVLVPECNYTQGEGKETISPFSDSSVQFLPVNIEHHLPEATTTEQMPAMAGTLTYQLPGFQRTGAESFEKSPDLKNSLHGDVRSMSRPGASVSSAPATITGPSSSCAATTGIVASGPETTCWDKDAKGQGTMGSRQVVHPGVSSGPMNPVDPRKKEFRCVWCAKEFTDNAKLKRHWRVHTGEKPFACHQCGKAYTNKENLVVHQRLHSGERPFSCDVCGKTFARKEKWVSHGRIHSGEKPYTCEVCGKAFKDSGNLSRHKRVHLVRRAPGGLM